MVHRYRAGSVVRARRWPRVAAFLRRVKGGFQRFLERPATVDLSHYEKVLKSIEWRGSRVEQLTDEELRAATAELRRAEDDAGKAFDDTELAQLCALGREAAQRGLSE